MRIRGGIVAPGTHPSNATHPLYPAIPGTFDADTFHSALGALALTFLQEDAANDDTLD